MPQSLYKNYIHIVFSTKHHRKLITEEFEGGLYSYMAGICLNLGCTPVRVGGHIDHVHILCLLCKTVTLAKLLEVMKCNSSRWMKARHQSLRNFYWQDGYGAFSVNPYEIHIVERYIANQKAHHSKQDFKTEFRGILEKHNIDYDERYVWD